MDFVSDPTELTTAATNFPLALFSLFFTLYLLRFRQYDSWKSNLWSMIMLLLCIGSFTGMIAHGLQMTETLNSQLWLIIYASLAFTVALFVISAIYDFRGKQTSIRSLFVILPVAVIFFILTQIIDIGFTVFSIYEGLAMLIALGLYIWLLARHSPKSNLLIILGIVLTIIAAIFQVIHSIRFTIIWQFNNNGLFHITQLIALVILFLGIHRALRQNKEA